MADQVPDTQARAEAPGQGLHSAVEPSKDAVETDKSETIAGDLAPIVGTSAADAGVEKREAESPGGENSSSEDISTVERENFPGLLRQLDELERRLSEFRGSDHNLIGAGESAAAASAGAKSRRSSDARNVPHVLGEASGALETAIRDLTARMALASRHGTLGDRVHRSSATSDSGPEVDSGEAFSMLAVGPPIQAKASGRLETQVRVRETADEDQAMARIHEARLVDLVSQQVRSSFRELATRLDASFAETTALKDMVAALGSKVEALVHGNSAERAAEDFTRELSRVADRLDQADRGIMSLNSLERTIEGLLEGFAALAAPGGGTAVGIDPGSRPGLVYKEANLAREIVALRVMQEETRRRFDVALAGFAASLSRVETALGSPPPTERTPASLGEPPARMPQAVPAVPKERGPKVRSGEKQGAAHTREGTEMLIEPGGGSLRSDNGPLDGGESADASPEESNATTSPVPESESAEEAHCGEDLARPPKGGKGLADFGERLISRGPSRYFLLAGGLALLLAAGALALAKVIQQSGLVTSPGP